VRTQRPRITVSGVVDEDDREAFGDFDIETTGEYTVLIGELDQTALLGVRNRLRALGLRIVHLSNQGETQES
jgi:hypothetical protein